MTQRDHREEPENPAIAAMHTGIIVLLSALIVLLAAGFGAAISAGYKVGPYAAFGGGLTCIAVAATLGIGVGALVCHRIALKDNARTRQMVGELLDGQRTLSHRLVGIEEFEGNVVKRALDELGARRANGNRS